MSVLDYIKNKHLYDESVKCTKQVDKFKKCREEHPVLKLCGRCDRLFMTMATCLKEELLEKKRIAAEQETSDSNS